MDCIKIDGLEVFSKIGLKNNAERKFCVDIILYTDIKGSGMVDDVDKAVDFDKVCEFIKKFLRNKSFGLMEAAVEYTSKAVLTEFPKIRAIDIRITDFEKDDFRSVQVGTFRKWTMAYLGISIFDGNKEEIVNQVIDEIYDDENTRVLVVSKFYEAKPYLSGQKENSLNGCLEIETLYEAEELYKVLCNIQNVEIDILLFGDSIINARDFLVPHMEMHKRSFVLEPLNQIAPYAIHPILKKTVNQLLLELKPENKCAGCGGCGMEKK